MEELQLKAWALPLIVAAILVPVIGGFLLAGPVLGLAVGFLAVATIALVAARLVPRGPIETAATRDVRRHVLLVLGRELDDAGVARLRREAELDRHAARTDLLVLAPATATRLDRWATDVRRARGEAQERLVHSLAALGKAGFDARAAVGDGDVVQAVEDQLRSFPASEVVLVTGAPGEDAGAERAAEQLDRRLQQPLTRLAVRPGAPTAAM